MKLILFLCLCMAAYGYSYSQTCNGPLRIVVLGSSTAWGNGLPNRDSAWLFRYQQYLKQNHHPSDTIVNLAQGGFTTQEIMPTGTPTYTVNGLTFSVSPNYNINKAVSLQPHAIIINMPTNDEARGFPLTKQPSNWLALQQFAAENNIPLWVTTTQPRGNLGFAAAARLRQMKDTINKYFGSKAIDFWTGLGDANGYILAAYNSGDDVHFNAAGHRILNERVVEEYIPDSLCAAGSLQQLPAVFTMTKAYTITNRAAPELKLFPNPARDVTHITGFPSQPYTMEVSQCALKLIKL